MTILTIGMLALIFTLLVVARHINIRDQEDDT